MSHKKTSGREIEPILQVLRKWMEEQYKDRQKPKKHVLKTLTKERMLWRAIYTE